MTADTTTTADLPTENDDDEDEGNYVRDEDQFVIYIRCNVVLDSAVSATRVIAPGKSVAFGATGRDGSEYWVVLGRNALEDGLARLADE